MAASPPNERWRRGRLSDDGLDEAEERTGDGIGDGGDAGEEPALIRRCGASGERGA